MEIDKTTERIMLFGEGMILFAILGKLIGGNYGAFMGVFWFWIILFIFIVWIKSGENGE